MKSNDLQTIYVMWLREMKRFLRSKSQLIGTLVIPFFFLFTMGFGFSSGFTLPNSIPNMNYLDFLVPGIIGLTMLYSSISAGISVLWDKEFGFMKEIMVAPVSRIAIILGRIAGGVTTALIQCILILIISIFMGLNVVSFWGIILSIIFMTLIGIGFIGLGVVIASIIEDTQGFSLIMYFVIAPIVLLSGVFFPVSNFPCWLRVLAYLDPLTYGIDGLRSSLIGFTQFPMSLSLGILAVFGIIMVLLSSYLFNKVKV